jgi:hypothetical protein
LRYATSESSGQPAASFTLPCLVQACGHEPLLSLCCGRASQSFKPRMGATPMTTAVLLLAPLGVVLGALYWVMSFYQEQTELNRKLWKKHGVEV